jgi:hypothetical protein
MTDSPMGGTYEHGRITLDGAVDWPDGARVEVVPHLVAAPATTDLASFERAMLALSKSFDFAALEEQDACDMLDAQKRLKFEP